MQKDRATEDPGAMLGDPEYPGGDLGSYWPEQFVKKVWAEVLG